MENGSSLKVRIQKLGTSLSNMVMPNIGAFIAWGVITALFIADGYLPNEKIASTVGPMLTYLLPLLIGYTGGHMVHGQRGAVVGAIATFGAIAGASVPMFIGAMIMGPLGGWSIKKFDEAFQHKIRPGFEMLVNNFSAGLIGFALLLLAFFGIGPIVSILIEVVKAGVEAVVSANLLPIANIIIEPAKVLFLNNALNHGIFTPLGTEQVAEAGKSILYLLEANPGPGLGILLAYGIFGKGSAKSSSWGATIIHFFGGIHEIYFPYVMMKPLMFLAAIAGGVAGTFTFQLLDAGLKAPSSPGSIIAIMLMAPKGFAPHFNVLAGVLVAAIVSFLVASLILKADKSETDDLADAQAATKAAKAQAKGQAVVGAVPSEISTNTVHQIIFACDAGMGSSAMGASLLRDKVKKAGLTIPVTNNAISNLTDEPNTLIVTQEELTPRAAQRTPRAIHVSVDNFLTSPQYDDIVSRLAGDNSPKSETTSVVGVAEVDLKTIEKIIFPYNLAQGSATMGKETLRSILAQKAIQTPVETSSYSELSLVNSTKVLLVGTAAVVSEAKELAPDSQVLVVDSLVATPAYDKLVSHSQN
ncbi:PTS mannitol transporter subunit IICB [Streptococcus cameli]